MVIRHVRDDNYTANTQHTVNSMTIKCSSLPVSKIMENVHQFKTTVLIIYKILYLARMSKTNF